MSRIRFLVAGALAVEGKEIRVWAARDPGDPERMKAQPDSARSCPRKFQVA